MLQVAVPDVIEACNDADILVFVVPHQFMQEICSKLQGHIKSTAIGVSLMKVTADIESFPLTVHLTLHSTVCLMPFTVMSSSALVSK